MMRPFATFSELILTFAIILACILPVFFVSKKLYDFSLKSQRKCYYSLVLSVFLALIFLFLSTLSFGFFGFVKAAILLRYALGLCSFCLFILVLILLKKFIF